MNTFNEIVNYINNLKSDKIKILYDYYFILFILVNNTEYRIINIFNYYIILSDNKPIIFNKYDLFEVYIINTLLEK
jgi:hypothetical protein